ncbi:MAG: TonB-dependent receptor family protein [Paludibacteraceae bacterium]|nr:TonB-dependent receptor family protein [Paludibacteraceae bacterium]
MKKILVLMLMAAMTITLSAQTIDGMVLDEQNTPLSYVTISVLTLDSGLVAGTITDEQGHYSLTIGKGSYIIQASFVGYATCTREVVVDKHIHLDAFHMAEEAAKLQDVVVEAKRPLIERQMDKLVMNVSQSTFAIGHSGQDILRKAPGVNIDKDGNVTVNGKSVEIYIDGRPSYMSGEQLKGLLMGTDASTIEKLEIITNPSSKYDAAGQGGIIDIKLKKNKSKGLNGTISGNYSGMYWRNVKTYVNNDMLSLTLNYRGAKTYTALALTQVYANQNWDMNIHSEQPMTIGEQTHQQYLHTHSNTDMAFQYYNLRLSNDFYIDNKNTLGFILNVPIMKIDNKISHPERNRSLVTWNNDTLQNVSSTGGKTNYSPQHAANLNYTHVFNDSLSRELTTNLDYNRFSTHNTDQQQNDIVTNLLPTQPVQTLQINTQQIVDIYSAKVDFQTAFWRTGMLEAGAKWVMSNTFNNMTTDSITNHFTSTRTTRYDYSEQVGAVYISAAKQFNQHWNAKVGLRGELTYAKGTFYHENHDSIVGQKPYFNLFPTAFVGYSPKELWNMNISYTRRIKRASYYQLNPFVSYYDAHSYECGNPDLQPEFNHQVDVNFSYSCYVTLGFNFAHTVAMQNQRVTMQENGDLMRTWVNFGTCTTHGGFLSLTEIPIVPKFKRDEKGAYMYNNKGKRTLDGSWLALTLNANCYYFINRAADDLIYGVQRSYWSSFYACLTAYLPKDCQLSIDGSYSAPCLNGYTEWGGDYDMNLAFKKQFLQKRLTLTFKVDDLLCSSTWTMRQVGTTEGYSSVVTQRANRHCVGIGLTYLFGQAQSHKWRKVGNMDETARLGSGGNLGK